MESFNGKGEYLPKSVFKDGAKWLLIPSKVVFDGLNIWPERQNVITKIVNIFFAFTYCSFVVGNYYNMNAKDVDLGSFAFTLSLLFVEVECIARITFCQIYKNRFVKILNEIYYTFWPSNHAEYEIHKEILQQSWVLFIYWAGYTSVAVLFVTQFLFFSYFDRTLLYLTTYPFGWWKSPLYEFMYVWQSFVVMISPFHVCGFDLFFVSLVFICVAQFKVLRSYFKVNFERAIEVNAKDAKEVVRFCVQHHNRLFEICKEVNEAFTYFVLLQYLMNIGTICLSSFTVAVVPKEFSRASTYLMGHMSQTFAYCYLGNELILESRKLSDVVFESSWNLASADKDLQKSLIMIMIRSQKPMQISAGGFGFLSIPSFLKLIQFAFSVYTLLNSLLEKQGTS